MTRYICIHGHFYQPPRENPWTGKIDPQPSAAPFANWNLRIADECYLANTKAKILKEDGSIERYVNNYEFLSYNFGPTLLRWFDDFIPELAQGLVDADAKSIKRFGHGTAMAQVYHHSILPLCDIQDKRTEVAWGIADFKKRYGRMPEGIWLAETAVDIETLEILAEYGIAFTILAPRQAKAVATIGSDKWTSVDEGSLDTSRPYLCELPSGKTISLFFYHGDLAMEVAFRGALDNGESFAKRIYDVSLNFAEDSLLHYATDGESYGHHHRYGEMALAYCFQTLDEMEGIEPINYATYLHRFPPTHKIRVHEPSSWSCVHGVGRWSENCGCVIDGRNEGRQEWRVHLRNALNALRDSTRDIFLKYCSELIKDPLVFRHKWLNAVLRREEDLLIYENYLAQPTKLGLAEIRFWMEHQKLALMMFTSCGWFFDTASGLEPVQILRYAKRLIEITKTRVDNGFENAFLEELYKISKEENGQWSGEEIWNQIV